MAVCFRDPFAGATPVPRTVQTSLIAVALIGGLVAAPAGEAGPVRERLR
jgi:hypothetical protein